MPALKFSTFFLGGVSLLLFVLVLLLPVPVVSENPSTLTPEFIGSEECKACHSVPELSESGFNIWEESQKEAHLFALTLPDSDFPEGTNDKGVMLPPGGTSWNEFAYVMGGYGWKATFIRRDGTQLTGAGNAQYNLETGEWTSYHPGEELGFDVECSRCHTTGTSLNGSWNGIPEDSLGTWAEIGVRCEGCHGPGSLHARRAFTTPQGETDVLKERCGDCHNNGGKKAPIPAEDGFVANHAQYQELEASRHGEVSFFTCVTCHEPHVALKFSDLAGNTFNGKRLNPIRKACQECHPSREPDHPLPIACVDCHMPPASKSAVGIEYANGGARGDVSSHIWRINSRAVSRDSMFTPDGFFLKADASGKPALTLDFACLGCHKDPDETLEWASENAKRMHATTRTTNDQHQSVPVSYRSIVTNFPNPFSESTTIIFELREPQQISLIVYNNNGQLVAQLASGEWQQGKHQVHWNGRSDNGQPVSSGAYFVQLKSTKDVSMQKMILLR